RVEIGSTINGTISAPTAVDYYVFAGKKGQRILAQCLTVSIDSRLNPELRLYDSNQRQVAFNRPPSGNDGLLDCTLPADGAYYIPPSQFPHPSGGGEPF